MEITEYNKKHAQATATMWNESRSHFGGGEEVETAQERHEKECNSGNIVTMLALEDDKVIGYCGLSEYKQDSGALYIPLLNAHPNYLGRGVGKALVLEAIKRTYESGWPRLDLYTWPGNTKAVPLYKRCGFFWEEREETTHLMNFIPQVLNHDLIKKTVTPANWYASLKRELAVEPDCEKNNGFSVYTYTFATSEETITVGIEHGGRSIYKIETEAYKIEWLLPEKRLFTQKDYQAKLLVENNTGKQLHIVAKGTTTDKLGIVFDLDLNVQGRSEYLLPFRIDPIENVTNTSEWRTQMICKVPLFVNGVPCQLACGYAIKEPLKIQTFIKKDKDQLSELALEVSNQQNEAVHVNVGLLGSNLMIPMNQNATVHLKALETGAVLFPFEFRRYGIEQLPLKISLETSGMNRDYETSTPLVIANETTLGYFEQAEHYTTVNGKNQMVYYKESFDILLNSGGERSPWMIRYPTFGEPLNDELATKGWETIQFHVKKTAVETKMIFPILEGAANIVANYRWHLNKIVEIEMCVENTSNWNLDLRSIILPIYFYPDHVYLPTETGLLPVNQVNRQEVNELPLDKQSEKWAFLAWQGHNLGLRTDSQAEWQEINRSLGLRWRIDPVKPQSVSNQMQLTLYPNVYASAETFAQSLGYMKTKRPQLFAEFANHGFINTKLPVHIQIETGKKEADQGHILIQEGTETRYAFKSNTGEINVTHQPQASTSTVPFLVQYSGKLYEKKRILQGVYIGNEPVDCRIEQDQELSVHVVSNGVLTFKASEAYYPTLYSLQTKREWLDNLYPNPGPKSWWNPWGGGMMTIPHNLQLRTVMDQNRTVKFVTMVDQWNQQWSGIKLSIQFTNHKGWNKAEFNQYYVTLPGASILVHVNELNGGPSLVDQKHWLTGIFFNRENLSIYPLDNDDEHFKLNGGQTELNGLSLHDVIRLYDHQADETLVTLGPKMNREFREDKDVFATMNTEPLKKWPDEQRVMSKPQVFVWTKGLSSSNGWEWLNSVTLKEVRDD